MNQIIKYAGLGEFINQPLYTYSSGMLLRLGFSIIIHLQADIYLFDEFLTVGDSDFQHQCQLSLATLKEKGKTILIASQNLNMLLPICSHILTLEKGYLYNKNPLTPSLLAFYKRAITKNPATTAIISNSMAPTLILGDNVSFHHRPIKQIQVGDIIAFAFHNMPQLICHRVTGITITKKGNAFITKGDANQTIDPWLVGDQEYVGVISIKNGKNI